MYGRLSLFALVAGVLTGCTTPDAAYREVASHTFKTNLVAETERVLTEAGGVLTLSNALELAHARSLKLAQQDFEAKLARICGLHVCSMGERILRCETAPVVAVTALMYATGNLS